MFAGIEFDSCGIRIANLEYRGEGAKPSHTLHHVEELRGDFTRDDALIDGLKKIRDNAGITSNVQAGTCIGGKQLYAAQMPFRKLKPDETRNALRLEIRKNLSFDAATATIEYQVVDTEDAKPGEQQIIVTAVANPLIKKHVAIMEKAGIKPTVIDTLPTCAANAFFTEVKQLAGEGTAHVIMHIGPSVTTLVIDGDKVPFFHRNIYFAADDLFGKPEADASPEQERQRRLATLTDEVMRSIAYYEKTWHVSGIPGLHLLGDHTDKNELVEALSQRTGLRIKFIDLCSRFSASPIELPARFALAITLAMRNE